MKVERKKSKKKIPQSLFLFLLWVSTKKKKRRRKARELARNIASLRIAACASTKLLHQNKCQSTFFLFFFFRLCFFFFFRLEVVDGLICKMWWKANK